MTRSLSQDRRSTNARSDRNRHTRTRCDMFNCSGIGGRIKYVGKEHIMKGTHPHTHTHAHEHVHGSSQTHNHEHEHEHVHEHEHGADAVRHDHQHSGEHGEHHHKHSA